MTAKSRHLNRPTATYLEHNNMRFLILDQPTNASLPEYVQECVKHHVSHLVCVCELNYATEPFEAVGIQVLNWEFSDGSPPPDAILDKWLALVRDVVRQNKMKSREKGDPSCQLCIAIHCKAGLGRAPVLVAVAMIETGLPYDEAVERIRLVRHGAFNAKQIQFLKHYQPKKRLRSQEKCILS